MVFKCARCAQCCKNYTITILPAERKAMAKEMNVSEEEFTQKNCELVLQLFPLSGEKKGLFIFSDQLSKRFSSRIEKKSRSPLPFGFLVLPSIALKKKKGNCILLSPDGNCLVHNVKPGQCCLFPFISMAENPDFRSLYPFCKGIQSNNDAPKDWKQKVPAHQTSFSRHFNEIRKNGFSSQWKNWPKEGFVLLKSVRVCSIEEKEFFKIIKDFR